MKRIVVAALVILMVVTAVILYRGAMATSIQPAVEPMAALDVDVKVAAEHLSRAVQFKTVSVSVASPASKEELAALRAWMEQTYPKTHATLKREVLNESSLLFQWTGSDASLKPLLVLGHMDVVPVDPKSEKEWKQPPFDGRIVDGAIWGRGTMDDKLSVVGALEAVEWLLVHGYQPKRTVLLSFGHDEEISGREGAQKTAALLKERGVQVECAIDEGGLIADGMMPGVPMPVALVGIAEKGYMTVTLRVRQPGGHSSMPTPHSAVGILAKAITRVEDKQVPGHLAGPALQLFSVVSPKMPFMQRTVFANLWLFRPLVEHVLSGSPETNAMIRTTTAVTMVDGGVKENVLPLEATATVNFRIMPGETIDTVMAHLRDVIGDERVSIELIREEANNPTAVSDTSSESYETLEKTIRQIFPDVLVAPYLTVAATDSRFYSVITPNIYRFVPGRFRNGETSMIHGVNEHISTDNFAEVVRYYVQLMKNFGG